MLNVVTKRLRVCECMIHENEEIDVVSVGDKNLPTNPTERDYRHLQSEVASKIRTASSRGTTNGSLPYGSGAHHHHHHYQRQHQLTDGPRQGPNHLGGIYPTPASSTTISGANTPLPTRSGGASAASSPPPACTSSGSTSRKRSVGGSGGSSKRSSNSSKRMRLSHSKRGGGDGNAGGRFDSCAQSLADELDTVEKRNLHNNLERQRRIGLKNLFEELKRQIPQLRDKDRAPKVNILREAATLCTRLNQEAEQANELRQQQIKLYERVRYLRASMYSQRVGLE
uniref:BHLH domain-containing protein n=1 Tax=Anopheles minimus TaxID=112268 RepID=A0A182W5W3_9DIPT